MNDTRPELSQPDEQDPVKDGPSIDEPQDDFGEVDPDVDGDPEDPEDDPDAADDAPDPEKADG